MSNTCPFETIPEKTEKPWGYELKWAHTEHYVGKILHINKGHRLSLQYHNEKVETMFVQSGKIQFIYGVLGEKMNVVELTSGQVFHVPAKGVHRVYALEDSDVFEVSTPQLQDIVRLTDDYKRK